MSLGNVEYDAVLERAVALEPPRILVIPHADGLCVPGLEFRFGIPACDVHVVHAAVMERRALEFVSFARGQPRCHVAYADDRQFADFALCDKILDGVVVPRIAQVKVHRREDFGLLGQRDRLPLLFHRVGDRFLGDDVLPARNCFLNLLRAGIRQCEQPDHLNLGVVEYDLFVGYYFRPGGEPLGQFP